MHFPAILQCFFCQHHPALKPINQSTHCSLSPPGAGKSTVVGLIERFYDPLAGAVMLDGVDIRQYNLRWLRQQVGLVSQEPLLFGGSIIDNIRFGNPHASMEEVVAAAEAANARGFVEALPEQYNTTVRTLRKSSAGCLAHPHAQAQVHLRLICI